MKTTQELFDKAMQSGHIRYPKDCHLICEIAKEKRGISMTYHDAQEIWEWYSENYAAGWLILDGREDKIPHVIDRYVNNRLEIEED